MRRLPQVVSVLVLTFLWSFQIQAGTPELLSYQQLYNLSPKARVQYIRDIRQALAEMERSIHKAERPSRHAQFLMDSLRNMLLALGPVDEAEAKSCPAGTHLLAAKGVCVKAASGKNCGTGFVRQTDDSGVSYCVAESTLSKASKEAVLRGAITKSQAGAKFAAPQVAAPKTGAGEAPKGNLAPEVAAAEKADAAQLSAAAQAAKANTPAAPKASADSSSGKGSGGSSGSSSGGSPPNKNSNSTASSSSGGSTNNNGGSSNNTSSNTTPISAAPVAKAAAPADASTPNAADAKPDDKSAPPDGRKCPSRDTTRKAYYADVAGDSKQNDKQHNKQKKNDCIMGGNFSIYNGDVKIGNCSKLDKFPPATATTDKSVKPALACEAGKSMCNPLLYCVQKGKTPATPFCEDVSQDLTKACEKAAGENDCDPVKSENIPAMQNEWTSFKEKFDQLCIPTNKFSDYFCEECQLLQKRVTAASQRFGAHDSAVATAPDTQSAPKAGTSAVFDTSTVYP